MKVYELPIIQDSLVVPAIIKISTFGCLFCWTTRLSQVLAIGLLLHATQSFILFCNRKIFIHYAPRHFGVPFAALTAAYAKSDSSFPPFTIKNRPSGLFLLFILVQIIAPYPLKFVTNSISIWNSCVEIWTTVYIFFSTFFIKLIIVP